MSNLTERDLKEAIINSFMELQKLCFKEVEEGIMLHQVTIKRNYKKELMEILKLKSTIIETSKIH